MTDPPGRLAADNERRLWELFDRIRARVARDSWPEGAALSISIRIEKGGRISRAGKLVVEELLQTEQEGA